MAHPPPWTNNKQKGTYFENFTEHCLSQQGIYVTEVAERRLCKAFGQDTEIDRLILDEEGSEIAILEIKSGQFNNTNQAKRLVSLAKQEDLKLIFATPDGTVTYFSPSVLRELSKHQFFVIEPANLKEVSQIKAIGMNSGLPSDVLDRGVASTNLPAINDSTLKASCVNQNKSNTHQKSQDILAADPQIELENLKAATPPRPHTDSLSSAIKLSIRQ